MAPLAMDVQRIALARTTAVVILWMEVVLAYLDSHWMSKSKDIC